MSRMTDVESFRDFCLGLGDVTEKMPFGQFARRYDSILAFYVNGHMFCFVDIDDFSWVNVRSTPQAIEQLRNCYTAVSNPMNRSLRYWITLTFNGDINDDTIKSLVVSAFNIVKEKYSKK